MADLLKHLLTETWFTATLLVLIIGWVWYFFYWIANKLINLLRLVLNEFLVSFKDMVNSIKELASSEKDSQAINSAEHKQNSKEHNKLLAVLEKLLDKCANRK